MLAERVGRGVVSELVAKAERARPGEGFRVTHVVFARAGFTEAAQAEAESQGVVLVDAETMERDLIEADAGG